MATLTLQKPEAGQTLTVTAAKDVNLELGFSPADATLTKEGDSLVFTFADGSKVEVADFYATVTKDALPDFIVEGQTLSGADFFAALDSDLMPAAGPAAAAAAANGGRFNDFGNADLQGGLDSLGGLDIGFDSAAAPTENLAPSAAPAGETPAPLAAALTPVPGASGQPVVPDAPEEPGDKPVVRGEGNFDVKATGVHGTGNTAHQKDSFDLTDATPANSSKIIDGTRNDYDNRGNTERYDSRIEGKLLFEVEGVKNATFSMDAQVGLTQYAPDGKVLDQPAPLAGQLFAGTGALTGYAQMMEHYKALYDSGDKNIEHFTYANQAGVTAEFYLPKALHYGNDYNDGLGFLVSHRLEVDGGTDDKGNHYLWPGYDSADMCFLVTDYGVLAYSRTESMFTDGSLQANNIRFFLDSRADAVRGLSEDQLTQLTFSLSAKGDNGTVANHTVTLNIYGSNDAPDLSIENGKLVIFDPDGADTHTLIVSPDVFDDKGAPAGTLSVNSEGAYTLLSNVGKTVGTLSFAADGTYVFTLDADYQGISSDAKITFTVQAQDNHGAMSAPISVTLTVNTPQVDAAGLEKFLQCAEQQDGKYADTLTFASNFAAPVAVNLPADLQKYFDVSWQQQADSTYSAVISFREGAQDAINKLWVGEQPVAAGAYQIGIGGQQYTLDVHITGSNANNDSLTIRAADLVNNATGQTFAKSAPLDLGKGDDTVTVSDLNHINGMAIDGDDGHDTFVYDKANVNMALTESGNVIIAGKEYTNAANFEGIGNLGGRVTMRGNSGDNTIIANGDIASAVIQGDSNRLDGKNGGADTIIINGNLSNAGVYGEEQLYNGAKGGDDYIKITGTVSGGLLQGGYVTGGAAGFDVKVDELNSISGEKALYNGSFGGNDTIIIDGDMKSSEINGEHYLNASTGGGDYIEITGTLSSASSSIGAGNASYVSGDAHLANGSLGGNDTMVVNVMTGGIVSGEFDLVDAGTRGGNDLITINKLSGGHVSGETILFDGSAGGNDTINVAEMTGGSVYGEGIRAENNTSCGDDSIHVGNLSSGRVFGDAENMYASATAGKDTIRIDSMSGGTVYGDGTSTVIGGADTISIGGMSGGTVYAGGGDDIVVVETISGALSKKIDGGAGTDMFIYNNAGNDAITLNAAGGVVVNGITGTTLSGFEGIGGGAGNDTLDASKYTANGGASFLRGGQGDDVLTGGAGNDVFIWARGDFGGSDTITDFGLGANKLYLGGLTLNDVTYDTTSGNGVITIVDDATGAKQTITLKGFTGNLTDDHLLTFEEFTNAGGNGSMLFSTLYANSDNGGTLHGDAGRDILHGGTGDDFVFGGYGDDVLFGGEGNDYLFGGVGDNQLYGGAGSDILVYSAGNRVVDGSEPGIAPDVKDEGTDYLVGLSSDLLDELAAGTGTLNLDDYLDNHAGIKNIEVLVFNGGTDSDVTGLKSLADMGIADTNGSLLFGKNGSAEWTNTGNTVTLNGQDYTVFSNANVNFDVDGDQTMQIAVLKNIIENGS